MIGLSERVKTIEAQEKERQDRVAIKELQRDEQRQFEAEADWVEAEFKQMDKQKEERRLNGR